MDESHALIRIGEAQHRVPAGTDFTFGRASDCSACLDPEDTSISRLAGSVERDGGAWWVVNRSAGRAIAVVDDLGLRSLLPPGRRYAVQGTVTVVVDGSLGSHRLEVVAADMSRPPAASRDPADPADPDSTTAVGTDVVLTDADRIALVALFAGYLHDGPRHDPHPRTYTAAAARLGWPRTTLVKRIEYLRTRLDAAGVPGVVGWNALYGLAEHVLSTGMLTREDLARLPA